MEEQFNHHHGVIEETYKTGQTVLAKDDWNGSEKWTQWNIVYRTANVIYEMDVQSYIFHANQLWPSFLTETKAQDATFLLDILLDKQKRKFFMT